MAVEKKIHIKQQHPKYKSPPDIVTLKPSDSSNDFFAGTHMNLRKRKSSSSLSVVLETKSSKCTKIERFSEKSRGQKRKSLDTLTSEIEEKKTKITVSQGASIIQPSTAVNTLYDNATNNVKRRLNFDVTKAEDNRQTLRKSLEVKRKSNRLDKINQLRFKDLSPDKTKDSSGDVDQVPDEKNNFMASLGLINKSLKLQRDQEVDEDILINKRAKILENQLRIGGTLKRKSSCISSINSKKIKKGDSVVKQPLVEGPRRSKRLDKNLSECRDKDTSLTIKVNENKMKETDDCSIKPSIPVLGHPASIPRISSRLSKICEVPHASKVTTVQNRVNAKEADSVEQQSIVEGPRRSKRLAKNLIECRNKDTSLTIKVNENKIKKADSVEQPLLVEGPRRSKRLALNLDGSSLRKDQHKAVVIEVNVKKMREASVPISVLPRKSTRRTIKPNPELTEPKDTKLPNNVNLNKMKEAVATTPPPVRKLNRLANKQEKNSSSVTVDKQRSKKSYVVSEPRRSKRIKDKRISCHDDQIKLTSMGDNISKYNGSKVEDTVGSLGEIDTEEAENFKIQCLNHFAAFCTPRIIVTDLIELKSPPKWSSPRTRFLHQLALSHRVLC